MKRFRVLCIGMLLGWISIGTAQSADEAVQIPVELDVGVVTVDDDGPCGSLYAPYGPSSYDTGYAWQYGGVDQQGGGTFAECFEFDEPTLVCGVFADITGLGGEPSGSIEVFAWADADGVPGAVVATAQSLRQPIPVWPLLVRRWAQFGDVCMAGKMWLGCRGAWPGERAGWFLGADINGAPPNCPLTRIAPGLSYPSGWQPVSEVWESTIHLGIMAATYWGEPCVPNPVHGSTWGRVKALYRDATR